jgi:hypothetical protein
MLKGIGVGAGLLVVAVVSGIVTAAIDGRGRLPSRADSLTQLASGKPFPATCKTSDLGDTRPELDWIRTSFADDSCPAPRTPLPVDGFTASREQIVAAMAATKRYAAASDAFQRCISDFLAARNAQSDKDGKPADAVLAILENQRIAASERSKKRVVYEVKAAIDNFNEYGSECPD